MNQHSKYHPKEVLEYFRAEYKQIAAYDIVAEKGRKLDNTTTIEEWRTIGDLVDTKVLWEYLDDIFKVGKSESDWMQILEPSHKKTLGDLCSFISKYGEKIEIKPRILFGKNCHSAAIFKTIIIELQHRGINTNHINPSTKLEEVVIYSGGRIIEIINLLNPKVLPPLDFKANTMYKWSLSIFIWAIPSMMIMSFWNTTYTIVIGIIMGIAYGLTWIGAKMRPKKAAFEGIDTMRDLIKRIELSFKK